MWQPDAGWTRLPGTGPSTLGAWEVRGPAGGEMIAKRFLRPAAGDPSHDPGHPQYWRREVDVALGRALENTPGLQAPRYLDLAEDGDGITLFTSHHTVEIIPGLHLAHELGRFSTSPATPTRWSLEDAFGHRIRALERRGGWTTLARTTVADVAAALWARRNGYAARLAEVRQVLVHGDATVANFLARTPDAVIAADWASFGTGPVGFDLGYLSLGLREQLVPLVDAYLDGSGHRTERTDVLHVARIVSIFTVLTRADWALSRAARGEGALAGKFNHPSVAPYLRALQNRHEDVAALLGL